VVAAARDASKARDILAELGLREGRQADPDQGIIFIESGVDVTDASTLTPELFSGVEQVICALGAVFGRTADGQMGYLGGMSPARIDADGVSNVATAASKHLPKSRRSMVTTTILPMSTPDDLALWGQLDDVIMGGNSSSALEAHSAVNSGAVWRGSLVIEGGGFCGARTSPVELDLSGYDGIALRVKGDGQTLKLNIKTDTFSEPEDTYQASFDTSEGGDWVNVFIPWHEFVPVKRARSVPNGPPLDPSKIRQFGLVYSRFAFNGFPNESYTPGPFEIQFEGGIRAFQAPRPRLVLVSSAGVERNARIGDDEEARKREIPIVQLNPGGILNHKYTGEAVVRATGLPYSVVRPCGLSEDVGAAGPALLEASQGDRISGKLTRSDVAAVVTAATVLPAATDKTFELRRQEALDAQGKAMTSVDMLRLFLGVQRDARRARFGIEPFPSPTPPPAPVTEERKKEILADPRVQAVQASNAGRRVRDEKESAAAAFVVSEEEDAAMQGRRVRDEKDEKKSESSEAAVKTGTGDHDENVQEVREWIRRWRARSLEKQLPSGTVAAGSKKK